MFKKFAIGIACIITASLAAVFAGCGDDENYDEKFSDRAKVIYELEGGKYRNSTTSVNHFYTLDNGAPCTITPLEDKKFSDDGVTRDGGFVLEGWYRTKTTENGNTEYSDKWDFATDTVTIEGVTLYAKWASPITYTFDFVYTDDNGEEKVAGSYKVNAGDKFGDVYKNDILSYAGGYAGHTAVAVYNDPERKIPFDDSLVHPGGEESNAVKLYVEYMEGSYTIVKTAAQLRLARSQNIYLAADIDMAGERALSFDNFNGKTFIGNGHKISNLTLDYRVSPNDLVDIDDDGKAEALCVAVFGNVENATVKGVTFENLTVKVDAFLSDIKTIYVAPLAVNAKDSVFEKVTVLGTFGYTDRTTAEITFVTDKGIFAGENATETDCGYEITLTGKIEN